MYDNIVCKTPENNSSTGGKRNDLARSANEVLLAAVLLAKLTTFNDFRSIEHTTINFFFKF